LTRPLGPTIFLQTGYICDKSHEMKGNRWEDHYARRAREEKWFARSVYKLQEIDRRFKLIKKGDRLLDLGCFPGSWSQYGLKRAGTQGEVVGIDLVRPDRLFAENFRFIQADVFTLDPARLGREWGVFDVVMSDLAPKTTGIKGTDASRSMELALQARNLALAVLKRGGRFVCKIFEGEDVKPFRAEVSDHFEATRLLRPEATRKGSREVYLVGLGQVKEARGVIHQ